MAVNEFTSRAVAGSALGGRSLGVFFALFLVALTAGCAQTRSAGPEVSIKRPAGQLTVLLMPADVQLSVLTTGGLKEPNAEWTEQGRKNVGVALNEEMAERNAKIVPYGHDVEVGDETAGEHLQLVKLHEAVGGSILLHKFVSGYELPTKKNKFDWTLGKGVEALRESYGADYALFVYAEDSFSSGGRVALGVATAILFGYVPQGGRQIAFASLVDLETGSIVWFNVLQSGGGDLRDPESARDTIDTLFDSSPL